MIQTHLFLINYVFLCSCNIWMSLGLSLIWYVNSRVRHQIIRLNQHLISSVKRPSLKLKTLDLITWRSDHLCSAVLRRWDGAGCTLAPPCVQLEA